MKHTGTEKIGLIHFLCTSLGSLGQPPGIPEGTTCQWSPKAEDALMQRTFGLGLLTFTAYDGEDSITAATDTLKQ